MIPAGSVAAKLTADFSGTGYPGATPATDITGYAITSPQTPGSSPLSVTWGRQQWQGDVTPSRMTGSLISQSGEFTPGNASSPFYPHVRRRARLHLALTVAGVTVDYFDGYANSWTATPQNGSYWYTPLDASDILNRMGSDSPLRPFVVEDALSHGSVDSLWMLDEAAESTSAGDVSGHQAPLVAKVSKYGGDLPTFGADTGLSGGYSGTGASFDGATTTGGVLVGTVQFSDVSVELGSIDVWFSTTATVAQTVYADTTILGVQIDASGYVLAPSLTSFPTKVNDGLPHHVRVEAPHTGSYFMYVDGVLVDAFGASAATGTLRTFTLPVTVGAFSKDSDDHFAGTIWAVARNLPVAMSDAGMRSNFSGDTTAARVARLIAYRANLGTVIDSTTVGTVGAADATGETLAAALLETAQVEGGVLFADGNGKINLRSRSRTFNPAAYLTMTAPPDVTTTFIDDIQNYVNDVTVTRVNGADMRAFSQADIDQYGEATTSLTVNCATDSQALDIASWLVALGTEDQLASPDLTIDLYALASTALALQVLQLRPLDVITLTNLPPNAPASTMSLVVQGGTLTVSTEQLLLSLYTTPMPPVVVMVDGDAAHGIDSTAILAY